MAIARDATVIYTEDIGLASRAKRNMTFLHHDGHFDRCVPLSDNDRQGTLLEMESAYTQQFSIAFGCRKQLLIHTDCNVEISTCTVLFALRT